MRLILRVSILVALVAGPVAITTDGTTAPGAMVRPWPAKADSSITQVQADIRDLRFNPRRDCIRRSTFFPGASNISRWRSCIREACARRYQNNPSMIPICMRQYL